MPAHAVVDLAVETTRRDRGAHRFAKLVNAVLRRVAERGPELLASPGSRAPQHSGLAVAALERGLRSRHHRRIAEASLREAPLDISAKSDAAAWAERLGGRLLSTGSIRLTAHGRIEDLPGYAEGAWWVQDAGAALVARAAGDVAGRTRCRPLRRARRQDRGPRRGRRPGHDRRPVGPAARAPARQPEAPRSRRRGRRGRRGRLVAGADLRRGGAGRALHGHRHDPPPPRHPAPEAPRGRGPHGRAAGAHARPRRHPRPPRRRCSSTAPARSSPRRPSARSRPSSPPTPTSSARP